MQPCSCRPSHPSPLIPLPVEGRGRNFRAQLRIDAAAKSSVLVCRAPKAWQNGGGGSIVAITEVAANRSLLPALAFLSPFGLKTPDADHDAEGREEQLSKGFHAVL